MPSRVWSRERRITAAILALASAIMFVPLVTDWFVRPMPMVADLGFSPATLAPPVAWFAALIFAAAYVGFTCWALPSVRRHQREISVFKLIGVVAAVASGIMEEVVFRRLLMDAAAGWGVGTWGQVVLSGVVFGLAHGVWSLFSANRAFPLIAVTATTAAGMALALIYLLAGRNLGPPIAAHFLINVVIEPWLVLAAVSGSNDVRHEPGMPPTR